MKKLLIISICVGLFLLFTSEKNLMLCKKMVGIKINTEEVRIDEYFKNLSENYYGTPSFSEQLLLVNNGMSNLSEEELIIPSLEAMNRLKNNQHFSIIKDTGHSLNKAKTEIDTQKNSVKKSSFITALFTGGILSFFLVFLSFIRKY